jgi:hypothetical protein
VEQTLVAAGSEGFGFAGDSPMRISWMLSSMDNNLSPESSSPAETTPQERLLLGYKPTVIIGTFGTSASIYDTKNPQLSRFYLLLI